MAQTLTRRLIDWNARMNDLPRKGLLVLATLLAGAALWLALPYVWPLAAGALCSAILEVFVRFMGKGSGRFRIARVPATLIGMLLLFGLIGWFAAAVIARLLRELTALLKNAPQAIVWLSEVALPYINEIYEQYRDILPPNILGLLNDAFASLGQSVMRLAGTVSAALTSGAWTTAASIPSALLSLVLVVMNTYYLTADRARVTGFMKRLLPETVRRRTISLKDSLLKALFGQLKSQLVVSLAVTLFLTLIFTVFDVYYGLLFALIIGFADALPIVGAGLFLIPWSLIGFVGGDVGLGALMALTYLGTVIIRQVLEPRVVSKNLGVYPLAAMAAMYAGYRALGFPGLLAGPVMLNLIKVILEADEEGRRLARGVR